MFREWRQRSVVISLTLIPVAPHSCIILKLVETVHNFEYFLASLSGNINTTLLLLLPQNV